MKVIRKSNRILSVVLTLLLCFSFVACNNNAPTEPIEPDLSTGKFIVTEQKTSDYSILIPEDADKEINFADKFDMIVSNPPYIPTEDIKSLSEEVKKEPMLALDGGNDGLDIIRFLIGEGLTYLNENGKMLIEFGYDQGEIMDTLLAQKQKECKIKHYEIIKDYGGNDRLALIIT